MNNIQVAQQLIDLANKLLIGEIGVDDVNANLNSSFAPKSTILDIDEITSSHLRVDSEFANTVVDYTDSPFRVTDSLRKLVYAYCLNTNNIHVTMNMDELPDEFWEKMCMFNWSADESLLVTYPRIAGKVLGYFIVHIDNLRIGAVGCIVLETTEVDRDTVVVVLPESINDALEQINSFITYYAAGSVEVIPTP